MGHDGRLFAMMMVALMGCNEFGNLPWAPSITTAKPGNASAIISFVAPVYAGQSAISTYVVHCTAAGETWSARGEAVYEEGSPDEKFFIVVLGTVRVSTVDATGTSIHLTDLQDGDYFGEGETLSRSARKNTVTATLPMLVLALRTEFFLGMVNEISSLRKMVTQMALARSLSMICSVGRRRRKYPIWQDLVKARCT